MSRTFEQAAAPNRTPARKGHGWSLWSRRGLGAFFCAMAGYNVVVVLPEAATAYREIAEELAWPGVDSLMRSLVVPRAEVFTVALAAAEVVVGVLIMSSGRRARVALGCAAAFMIGLFPIVSYYALANVPLVLLALVLLRRDGELAVQPRSPR